MPHGDDKVTIGEVFRLIESLKEEHGEKLDGIDKQVRLTNGRTTRLEENARRTEDDIRRLNSAVFQKPSNSPTPNSLPVVTPEGESLSIKISPKMWALIASAFMGMSMFGPILTEWLKKFLDRP